MSFHCHDATPFRVIEPDWPTSLIFQPQPRVTSQLVSDTYRRQGAVMSLST